MKEATKTICFVVAAAVMLTAAIASNVANRPRPVTDFETIGQPFYPDFVKTDVARSLIVNSLDELAVKRQTFEIKQEDGLWQIPSHEGYPAEAAQRLAQTSASLMGITRDSLVGRSVADHVKFGVIDPRGEDIVNMDAVGQSITLRDANDDVLVDLIIGKEATSDGDRSSPGQLMQQDEGTYYYVRRQDESNVYRIPLQIDLSTKFADWIEPDLLQIEADKVVAVKLNNYQIEQRGGGMFGGAPTLLKKPGDQIALARESSTDDWTIEDIAEETETLKSDEVSSIVGVLDDMAIVDVKRKPTLDGQMLLDADLNYSLTPEQAKLMSVRTQQELDQLSNEQKLEFQSLQVAIAELQQDLQSRGFNFGSTGEKLELVSAGGEVQAATSDGLLYTLHVGKANASDKKEIKVAGASDEAGDLDESNEEKPEGQDDANGDDAEPSTSDSEEDAETDSQAETSDNRYVLIRVGFDESYIGAELKAPKEPVAPIKPEGYTPEPEQEETEGSDEESGDADDDAAPKPKAAERDEKFAAYDVAVAAYEEAKIDFEVATSEFKREQEERAAKIKEGKQKAKILNQRFEDWYYVVSGENLTTLQADRETLIEVKEPPKAPLDGLGTIPDTSFPNIDVGEDAATATADPEMKIEKPSTEKPPTEMPEAKPPTEEPAASKNEESKPDTTKAAAPETKAKPPADSEVEAKEVKPDSEAPAPTKEVKEQESP